MKKILLGTMIMIAVMFNVNIAKGEGQVVEKGKVVKFDYTLTVDGKVVDSSKGKGPLEYTQGKGMILKALETSLTGLKVGDEKHVTLSAEEGYGAFDEKAIIEIPKSNLNSDIDPKKGMILQLQNQQGQTMVGKILEVKDKSLMLDFNHPLAGKELVFDVKIVGIE